MKLTVGDLREVKVQHPSERIIFELCPEHIPEKCNYAHAEVVAWSTDLDSGDRKPLQKIKPSSVKLALRHFLQGRIRVAHPKGWEDRLPLA